MRLVIRILHLGLFFIPLFFACLIGINRPATYVADSDLYFISEALRYNSNQLLIYSNQPSYFSVIILGWWLRLLQFLSLTSVSNVNDLIFSPTPIETLQNLAFNTRILSALISGCYVLAFISLLKNIRFSTPIVISGGILLACSEGLLMHSVMYRTETLSIFFVTLSLISLTELNKLHSLKFTNTLVIAVKTSVYGFFAAISNSLTIAYFSILLPLFFLLTKISPNKLIIKNERFLTLQYLLLITFIFLFLSSDNQILNGELTLTKSILGGSILVFFLSMFFKRFNRNLVLAMILGAFIGVTLAGSINFSRLNSANNLFIQQVFENTKTFRYYANTPEASMKSNVFLLNFLSSFASKFSLNSIISYPLQLLFLASLFFFTHNLIKKNWLKSSQIALLIFSYLVFESLTKQQNFLPFNKLNSDINFNSRVVYRIYLEFYLLFTYCICIDHFLTVKKGNKSALFCISIFSILISAFSFLNAYKLTNEDRFHGFSLFQDRTAVCSYLGQQASLINYHLNSIAATCEDAIIKIEGK